MKRVLALLLTILFIVALAACASGGGESGSSAQENTPEPTEPPVVTIAQDNNLMDLTFTVPDGVTEAERFVEYLADGTIVQKNITLTLADESFFIYAWGTDTYSMDDVDLSDFETVENDGKTFYIKADTSDIYTFAQTETTVYGLQYHAEGEADRAVFDAALEDISFTDKTETLTDDQDLFDIRYTLDESMPLYRYNTNVTQTADGELVKKSVTWTFGKDEDNQDACFRIRYYKNTTVEDVIDPEKEYEEQEINGITYTVRKVEDEEPAMYYTQHGDDVYFVYNVGISNGWWTDRSDESEVAFKAFLETISFA